MNSPDAFDRKLSILGELCTLVGVNIQPGQELIVTAPLEASALVHYISRAAYKAGAKLVTCLYEDPQLIHSRFKFADEQALDYGAEWISCGLSDAFENGAARLYVVGPYPDLLAGVPADKVVRAHTSMAKASAQESRYTSGSLINWSTVPFVTESWAKTVFPGLPVQEATHRLWESVFDVIRINCSDPVGAWKAHIHILNMRRDILQGKNFSTLHFFDGRTDLMVGLVEGHRWVGGNTVAVNGIDAICNMPTEEVFTCPHRERTNGRVIFSKPLAIAGTLVEDLSVEFRDGLAVSVKASKGQETFEKLISDDEGARRLGEVGLVPDSSPISQKGILFLNALLDENAASHVAFGQSYTACLSTDSRSSALPEETGANQSAIHIDCMLGNASMSVDGITKTGISEPVMREGEFVI